MKALLDRESFYLFGMGDREKMIYKDHTLYALADQRVIASFDSSIPARIMPDAYRVMIGENAIWEDEKGVHLLKDGTETLLCKSQLTLPDFAEYEHAALMRILHADILLSIVNGKPVPNPFVYDRPWYRDSAMMCMVLVKTGNIHLVKNWILSLNTPYDRNNKGNEEPDNLGQALYMISLVSDASHPLVKEILAEAGKRTVDGHLTGLSDYCEHPVYQTKWLKFGLKALGLEDSWRVPDVDDDYAELFWMECSDAVTSKELVRYAEEKYPYLNVAKAHYRHAPLELCADAGMYPVSWEREASEAAYDCNLPYLPAYAALQLGAPHTWHASELLLYLMDMV